MQQTNNWKRTFFFNMIQTAGSCSCTAIFLTNIKRTGGVELGREINTTPVTREKIEIASSHHVDNY